MRKIIFLMLVFLVSNCFAKEHDNLSRLMQAMAQVPASEAKFTEKKYIAMLKAPVSTSGTLSYVRPHKIEKHITSPYDEILRVEADTLTVENLSKGEKRTISLKRNALVWAFVESIRGTLAGDLASLQRFYTTKLVGDFQKWRLSLEPRHQDMAEYVEQIKIEGTQERIQSIEILEANGDKSIMMIN